MYLFRVRHWHASTKKEQIIHVIPLLQVLLESTRNCLGPLWGRFKKDFVGTDYNWLGWRLRMISSRNCCPWRDNTRSGRCRVGSWDSLQRLRGGGTPLPVFPCLSPCRQVQLSVFRQSHVGEAFMRMHHFWHEWKTQRNPFSLPLVTWHVQAKESRSRLTLRRGKFWLFTLLDLKADLCFLF